MVVPLKVFVCFGDVGTRFKILPVNIFYDIWACDGQKIIIPFQVRGIVRKPYPTIILLFQLVALDHGAHGTIQDQNAVLQLLLELGQPLCAGRWCICHDKSSRMLDLRASVPKVAAKA